MEAEEAMTFINKWFEWLVETGEMNAKIGNGVKNDKPREEL